MCMYECRDIEKDIEIDADTGIDIPRHIYIYIYKCAHV